MINNSENDKDNTIHHLKPVVKYYYSLFSGFFNKQNV